MTRRGAPCSHNWTPGRGNARPGSAGPCRSAARVRARRYRDACRLPSELEPDSLGERQFAAVVDGIGGAAHVGLPGIRAGLTAAAGFLLAAERAADLGAARADVDVDDAAVAAAPRHEALGLANVVGEDARG